MSRLRGMKETRGAGRREGGKEGGREETYLVDALQILGRQIFPLL